jgi:hypothetical protein
MFGQTPDTLWLHTACKLNTRDPRLVQLYNSCVKQEMFKSGFTKRFADFSARHASGEWSNMMIFTYNELQQENTSIRQQVEAGLRKLKMGGAPWSPKFQVYRNEIEIWRMMLRHRKHIKSSISRIRRFIKKIGLSLAFTFDIDEVTEFLKLAFKAYKLVKKYSLMWCNDHLVSLAQSKADQSGTDEKTESRNMIRIVNNDKLGM